MHASSLRPFALPRLTPAWRYAAVPILPLLLLGCGTSTTEVGAPPTATAVAAHTPAATASIAAATATPTLADSPTATATSISIVGPTRSLTPEPTATPESTASPSPSPSATASPTITWTPTATRSPTPTMTPPPPPEDDAFTDVLLFSRTEGFRHTSIGDAVALLTSLPPEEGLRVTATENPTVFNDDFLARFEVIAFVNTTGDVLDAEQQAAMERFIRSGRGFAGVHSAADTEYSWPWYGQLVGAYFRSHPLLPVDVEVTTEDNTHPSTAHLPPTFNFIDEIYNFDRNPRNDSVILLTIDEAGFIYPNTPPTASMGTDHPIAWYKEFDGGRSFYTNLGHRPETWRDPQFVRHLLEGIRWAAAPVSYSRTVLTRAASNPMALAVAPDGRVFYIERSGIVRVWHPDTGRVIDAMRLDVSLRGENGLLGIALDPDFAANSYVYLYLSLPDADPPPAQGPPGINAVVRYTADAGSLLDPSSRVEILAVPSDRTNHEAGGLAFAPDGTLFLSTGDNTIPFESGGFAPIDERPGRDLYNAQRTAANPFDLRGKILRINPDGSIPAGNLFPPDGSLGRPEVFAMGARNPFRVTVDPASGRVFWGDVGPDATNDGSRGPRGYDEINYADVPGNYGWPYCIANNRPYSQYNFATQTAGPPFSCDGFRPALLFYDYSTVSYLALGNAFNTESRLNPDIPIAFTGRTAIAGVFYRRPPGDARFALPAPYADTLLMTEWTRDILASVAVAEDGTLGPVRRLVPWEKFHRPIDLDVGPDGALYVLEFGTGLTGDSNNAQLSRIEHSATGDLRPVAVITADVTAGTPPLTVHLQADGSRVPGRGGEIAAYEWDVDGDGDIDSTAASFEYTFTEPGQYPVSLVVVSAHGDRSLPAVVDVVAGNTPPQVRILQPADGARFRPGDTVVMRGEVTDLEDGTVACNAVQWDVRLVHNAHAHPQAAPKGCTATFRVALTDHGDALGLSYVIELAYTDRGAPGLPPLTGRAQVTIGIDR